MYSPLSYLGVRNDSPGLMERLASQGRFGDTIVAHISPEEASLLKRLGGSGTINPKTGLPEFWGWSSFFSGGLSDLVNAIAPSAAPYVAPIMSGGLSDIVQGNFPGSNIVSDIGGDTAGRLYGQIGTSAATGGLADAYNAYDAYKVNDNYYDALDRAVDPGGSVDYSLRKVGDKLPEGVREVAPAAGTVIGGIVGSYVPVIGTAIGAGIGRGVGGKLAGQENEQNIQGSAIAAGTAAVAGGAAKALSPAAAGASGGTSAASSIEAGMTPAELAGMTAEEYAASLPAATAAEEASWAVTPEAAEAAGTTPVAGTAEGVPIGSITENAGAGESFLSKLGSKTVDAGKNIGNKLLQNYLLSSVLGGGNNGSTQTFTYPSTSRTAVADSTAPGAAQGYNPDMQSMWDRLASAGEGGGTLNQLLRSDLAAAGSDSQLSGQTLTDLLRKVRGGNA